MQRLGIEFSGGRCSFKLFRMFKRYRPKLFIFMYKGMESLEDFYRYFAEKERLQIAIIKDMSISDFHSTYELRKIRRNNYSVIAMDDPIFQRITPDVDVLLNGRKHRDFIEREHLIDPDERIWKPRKLIIKGVWVKFPLWYEK